MLFGREWAADLLMPRQLQYELSTKSIFLIKAFSN